MTNKTVCTRNAIRCKKCGDVIESKSGHDFRTCSCKSVMVDGGIGKASHITMRRLWPSGDPDDWFEDVSEYEGPAS